MNKSISISLGGLAFFIEEDAYSQLQKYIDAVRNSLRHDDDKEEIITDVETRIAELFKNYLGKTREVINNQDVSQMIGVLGTPEQINDLDDQPIIIESKAPEPQPDTRKKFYRDADDKFIGGVCSGLAHYIGFDVVWIRIILLSMLLTIGFGSIPVLLFYVIMLVVVPEATTVSEKLEMRGKPITFDSIKNWSEIEKAGSKMGKSIESIFATTGTIFSKIFGIGFIMIGVGLIGLTITLSFYTDFIDQFPFLFFDTEWKRITAYGLCYFIILIPTISFLFMGIRLLFKRSKFSLSPIFSTSIIIIWIVAIFALINLSVFNYSLLSSEMVEKKISIELPEIKSDTVTVRSTDYQNLIKFSGKPFFFGNDERERNIEGDTLIIKIKNEMEIIQSKDSLYRMEIAYVTHIGDRESANNALANIQYKLNVTNNIINMNTFLKVHKSEKYKNQDVRVTLYVPSGKYMKNENIDHFYFNHGNGYHDFWNNYNTLFMMNSNKFINLK